MAGWWGSWTGRDCSDENADWWGSWTGRDCSDENADWWGSWTGRDCSDENADWWGSWTGRDCSDENADWWGSWTGRDCWRDCSDEIADLKNRTSVSDQTEWCYFIFKSAQLRTSPKASGTATSNSSSGSRWSTFYMKMNQPCLHCIHCC